MGYQVFENHEHMVDIVVDLGEDLPGTETTVLDLTGDEIVVIREGAEIWTCCSWHRLHQPNPQTKKQPRHPKVSNHPSQFQS